MQSKAIQKTNRKSIFKMGRGGHFIMGRLNTLRCTIVLLFIPLGTVAGRETTSPSIDRIRAAGAGLGAISMVLTPSSERLGRSKVGVGGAV